MPFITKENAKALSALANAKIKALKEANANHVNGNGQELSEPLNPLADGLSRAQREILSRLRAADEPKEIAACARALREVRETWHMVTGEPRPGIRRESGRKSASPPAGGFHLPPANCGPQPTTNGSVVSEQGLTKPQAGQVEEMAWQEAQSQNVGRLAGLRSLLLTLNSTPMKQNPSLYGADKLECELYASGWVRSPNNIHSLPSVHWMSNDPLRGESPIWYPGCDGMPDTPENTETQVMSDRIRVFSLKFFGEASTKLSHWDTVTVAMFDNVPAFLEYCKASGNVARSLPAYANGWD